jgi:FKBP-type peptidyl-prolyl cis-trans isomerase (trigger factor)
MRPRFKQLRREKDMRKTELGISSVEEYYEHVKSLLMSEAIGMAEEDEKASIIKYIVDNSKFRLNEDVVISNAVTIYNEHKMTANSLALTISEYANIILNISEDQLYEECYAESAYQIKLYLTIGGIAHKEGLTVTEQELSDFVGVAGYGEYDLSGRVLCYMEYSVLEGKVLSYVYEKAILE